MRWIALLSLLGLVACSLDDVNAPNDQGPTDATKVRLQIITPQAGDDSLGFVFAWPAVVPGRRQLPIAGYNTLLLDAPTATVVDSGFVTGTVDTLWSAMPPLDQEQQAEARVQAVDTAGAVSQWTSRTLTFTLASVGPSAPDSIIVDTIPGLSALFRDVLPDTAVITMSDSLMLCVFVKLDNGSWWGPDAADENNIRTAAALNDSIYCWGLHAAKYG